MDYIQSITANAMEHQRKLREAVLQLEDSEDPLYTADMKKLASDMRIGLAKFILRAQHHMSDSQTTNPASEDVAQKALKIKRPVKRKPRRALANSRTRRPQRRRKRMIHVI